MNLSAGGGGASAAAEPRALFNPEDLACPICVETIEDAFATPCGHTFCFKCISTHLKNKSTCPSCGAHLVQDQIHPNFLLNKVGRD
jgi:E3 ubiquitin-protein ligase RFWD2